MANDQHLFLTRTQALASLCHDFQQYEPQLLLFCEILPIISDGALYLKRDPARNGVWINSGSNGKMRWLDGPALVRQMCHTVSNTPLNLERVASLCARVFQTRAETGIRPESNTRGIFIETGMAHFECKQCGRCCRTLDYHNEVTAADVQHWKTLGKQDIVDWVGVSKNDGQTAYRIWVHPGTGQLAPRCPFLTQHASENRWSCGIHLFKPTICRDYPVSRKHGLMTGCMGF